MKINHIQSFSVAIFIGWVLSIVFILIAIPILSAFANDIDLYMDANPHKVANTFLIMVVMYMTLDCFRK